SGCRRRRRSGARGHRRRQVIRSSREPMMKRFEGRVAVVSGAAQGMGKAVALRLGQEGATVVCADINGKGAEATAQEVGGKSFGQQTDIGDPAAVSALFKAVEQKCGKLDVLVNVAAIVPFVKWDELNFEEWRR